MPGPDAGEARPYLDRTIPSNVERYRALAGGTAPLRLPTGQAVARALRQKLSGVRDIPVLRPNQIRNAAASADQVRVLRDARFLNRTPLWYYILAEAAVLENGQRLGPVGGTIVAEVLVGLVRRSENSILRRSDWEPTLPSAQPGTFTLTELLRVARVLRQQQ